MAAGQSCGRAVPFADIVGGMFSIPAIAYYLSVIGLFLFLTGQALERRRWN